MKPLPSTISPEAKDLVHSVCVVQLPEYSLLLDANLDIVTRLKPARTIIPRRSPRSPMDHEALPTRRDLF